MKNRFLSETMLILILLLLMVLLLAARFTKTGLASEKPGAIENGTGTGTQLFFNWLAQRGHPIRVAEEQYALGETAVLFIVAPTQKLNWVDAQQIEQWVANGGILILVQEQNNAGRLLDEFDIRSQGLLLPVKTASFNLPTLNWPRTGDFELRTRFRYAIPCGEAAVHLGDCRSAHLATFGYGAGQVVLLSSMYPLTNEGLRNPANAQLMQNLIELVTTPGQSVLVDEIHHTGVGAFWRSAALWALVLTAVLLIAYFLWQSQPFENPVGQSRQIKDPDAISSSSGFINHVAEAQKDLDPQRDVREFFWRQVKRKYANYHGLDPNQSDDSFFEQLRDVEDEITIGHLIYIMTTMTKQQISDMELMHWTAVTLDHLTQKTVTNNQ